MNRILLLFIRLLKWDRDLSPPDPGSQERSAEKIRRGLAARSGSGGKPGETGVPPLNKSALPFDDPDALFADHMEEPLALSFEERLENRRLLHELQSGMDELLADAFVW